MAAPHVPSPAPVAIVLPAREGFGPDSAGAVALLVERLARATLADPASRFAPVVFGTAQARPVFADVPFISVHPSWWPGTVSGRHAAGLVPLLRRMQPALVEVHNRPAVALRLAARLGGSRIMLMLHNDPQEMRGARSPAERAALLGRLGRVVCVSAWLRAQLLEGVSAPARAPAILPNCLDLAALPPAAPAEARDRTILFTGRLVPQKGADAFVTACARALPGLPGWTAEMIGADRFATNSPETAYIRTLRAAAEPAGIRLLGYRPHAEVLAALGRAAIAVVPSRWQEPFGLAALEALAMGAPLIAAPRGGLPEVAGNAALYADPDDIPALAAAISALANDPARRAAAAAAGHTRARHFGLPEAAAALNALRMECLPP